MQAVAQGCAGSNTPWQVSSGPVFISLWLIQADPPRATAWHVQQDAVKHALGIGPDQALIQHHLAGHVDLGEGGGGGGEFQPRRPRQGGSYIVKPGISLKT